MGILENIREWFSSEQWVNKTSALIAGFLVSREYKGERCA